MDRALHLPGDHGAAYIDELAVLDARRTGGLAVSTSQATIQMQLRGGADFSAFKHFLDEVNPAPWAIEFIAQLLIGRTGGLAEAAVYAATEHFFRLIAFGRAFDP